MAVGCATEERIACFSLALLTSLSHVVTPTMHETPGVAPNDIANALAPVPMNDPAIGWSMMCDAIGGVGVTGTFDTQGSLDQLPGHGQPSRHPTDL